MRRMGSRASLPISLTFKPFDFHGHLANCQVVSFGYRYATTVVLSLRLRRSVVSRFPAEQGCRDIWLAAEGVPPSADQRVSTGRENRLASRQGAVQRGRWRIAACTVRAAFLPEGRGDLGSSFARGRAALGLSSFRGRPHRVGAQHSCARSASLFNYPADAHCEGTFW
jgi:hypothetical protein